MKRKGFFVARRRNGFQLRAPLALRKGHKIVIEAPRQALSTVSGPDSDQMHIGGRPRLREKAKEVSRHTISIFDDIRRIAELVHEHGMMEAQGTVTAPEVLDLGNDLIVVSLSTMPDFHKGSDLSGYEGV